MSMAQKKEPLTCANCGRQYPWRQDYGVKPCPRCHGRLRPLSASTAGDEPQTSPEQQRHAERALRNTPTSGGRRWLGDAAVAGRPLSRVVDSACHVVSGGALMAASTQPDAPGWLPAAGLGAIAYGVYIFATDRSYWMSTWIYVIAGFVVLYSLGLLRG